MFATASEAEYEEIAEGGRRFLFDLARFEFADVRDGDGTLRHVVVERTDDGEAAIYRVDRDLMYEFLARYLAGEYEKREYRMDLSPAHQTLLDALEMAAARARAGDPSFDAGEMNALELEPAGDEEDWTDDAEEAEVDGDDGGR
jgi:hypothetical protein